MKKSIAIFLCLTIAAVSAYAQARYWSIFAGGSTSHKFDLSANPAGLSTLTDQSYSNPLRDYENSVFDNNVSGSLVFSVVSGEVFSANGSSVGTIDPAESEIEIINIPCYKKHYYLMYWKYNNDPGGSGYNLVLQPVDASGTSISLGTQVALETSVSTTYHAGVVAAKANSDGSRYVYTIENNTIKRWTFYTNGTYSSATTLTTSAPTLCGNNNILELTPDGNKIYYVEDGSSSNVLCIYNISGNSFTTRSVPAKTGCWGAAIKGLEYAPSTGNFYVAYTCYTTSTADNHGGIGYWDESSSATFVDNTSTGINAYSFGDLEYGANGLLYFTATPDDPNDVSMTHIGMVATINPIANGSPSLITSGASLIYNGGTFNGTHNYYICNQIDGENYATWWPHIDVKLNGGLPASNPGSANVYTCGSGTIVNGTIEAPGFNFVVEVHSSDASGGEGTLEFSTEFDGNPSTINLLDLNDNYLVSHTGYHVIEVALNDPCNQIAKLDDHFLIDVKSTTPGNTGGYTWSDEEGVSTNCESPKNITTPETFGIDGTSSDGVIDWYYLVIDQMTSGCGGGATTTNISDGSSDKTYIYGDVSLLVADIPTYVSQHAPTSMPSPNPIDFFTGQLDQTFKVTLVTGNACSSESSAYSYMKITTGEGKPAIAVKTTTGVNVYPNPASNFINVNGYKDASYTITNTLGQAVLTGKIAGDQKINIAQLANGIYFIDLSGCDHPQKLKFVKQ